MAIESNISVADPGGGGGVKGVRSNTLINLILFGLLLYVTVNSYGHVGTVSSSNHTFFLGKLEQAVI